MKRRITFKYIREEKCDIACLQETYLTDELLTEVKRDWHGEVFYSGGTRHSNGLLILINPKFQCEKIELTHKKDRYLIIQITLQDELYTIVNCYAPSSANLSEKLSFLDELETTIQNMYSNYILVCGDFNMILDNNLDNVAGNSHSEREIRHFRDVVASLDLSDVCRKQHTEEKLYTWCRTTPFTARRLDYIFTDSTLETKITEATIKPFAHSDHRLVCACFKINEFQRGPGYWKLNSSLLNDADFKTEVNNLIDNHFEEYQDETPGIAWEMFKVYLKQLATTYAMKKASMIKQTQKSKQQQLAIAEERITKDPQDREALQEIQKLRTDIELYEMSKARGAQIRSREKWIDEGEKNTKYYLGLEKSRGAANNITKLKFGQQSTDNPKTILKEIKSFYENLYKRPANDVDEHITDHFLKDETYPILSDEEKMDCEEDITIEELTNALNLLNNNSAPGSDGLPPVFYKTFWEKLKGHFHKCLQYAVNSEKLSFSMRNGIIRLLHKGKDLDRQNLSNYRPITLTNTDYKIVTKVLALRMQKVIKTIINEDQAGFVKGRNIATHLRQIDDIIAYLNNKNKPRALIALDFAKAFDTLSKKCIVQSLETFNFGPRFIGFVKTIMKDTESCIINGGWISDRFNTERGIRQGCPLSPLLFIVAVEMMAIKIRNCKEIQGIKVNDQQNGTHKIIQFADDTTLTMKDERDIRKTVEIIEKFQAFSGLKLNKLKCQGTWLGSRKNETGNCGGIRMLKEKIKILGIYFSSENEASLIEENWTEKIEKILRVIKKWENRNPSLYGKVILVKTLLLSQLSHLIQALACPETMINRINSIIYRFLWKRRYNNKKAFEKIKRSVLSLKISEGGLNMINFGHQQKMFLVKWAGKLVKEEHAAWSQIPRKLFEVLGGATTALNANIGERELKGKEKITSFFWKTVLCTVAEMNRGRENKYVNRVQLWNNQNILYKGKPLLFTKWAMAGINHVQDLWRDGSFMTIDQVEQTVGTYAGLIFDYYAIYNAIPRHWREEMVNYRELVQIKNEINTSEGNLNALSNKDIRRHFVKNQKHEICAANFWRNKLGIEIQNYFNVAHECTKESRLRLLHFKFSHNIYPTNIMLEKMGVTNTNKCHACGQTDYIEHAFYQCKELNKFWKDVKQHILIKTETQIDITETIALFGIPKTREINTDTRHEINHILLIAKMAISKYKYGKIKNLNIIFETDLQLRNMK